MDEEEDRRYGKDKRGDELPEELSFREGRLEKIREAMAALEAEAQAQGEAAEAEGKAHPGVPGDKAQRNFTDRSPASCPGRAARTSCKRTTVRRWWTMRHQVIVATRATNVASDKGQAVVMIGEAIANTGKVPKEVSADAGYYSAPAVADLQAWAPTRTSRRKDPPRLQTAARAPGTHPQALSPRDRMRRKLQTKRGRQRYGLRMATVEPVFGQIKQGRGFRQFLLRGLEKVQGEWSLICTGHNLLKLFRFGERAHGKGVRNPTPSPLCSCRANFNRGDGMSCLHPPHYQAHQHSSDGLLGRRGRPKPETMSARGLPYRPGGGHLHLSRRGTLPGESGPWVLAPQQQAGSTN